MSDIVYDISNKICVRKSDIHGHGIFAKEDISKDEVLEVSRLLRLAWRMAYQQDPVIRDYCWGNTSCKCDQCKMHGPHAYLALGYGSIYNHHNVPNTKIHFDFDNNCYTVTSVMDIQKDQEIFTNYGADYWKHRGKILTAEEPTV